MMHAAAATGSGRKSSCVRGNKQAIDLEVGYIRGGGGGNQATLCADRKGESEGTDPPPPPEKS